jgi:hypothetical protein
MIAYTIRYYRSQEWADRFARAGILKPSGWVTSRTRYAKRVDAQRVIDHINEMDPEHPCELVEVKDWGFKSTSVVTGTWQ